MTLRNKLARLRKAVFTIARRHGATYVQATRVAFKTTQTAKKLKLRSPHEIAKKVRKGKRLVSGKYTKTEKRKIARAMSRALKNAGI